MLKPGKYQHFKGSFYQVLHIARHSETEDYFVVYHPHSNKEDIWVRPLTMFTETIERDGKILPRFQFISS